MKYSEKLEILLKSKDIKPELQEAYNDIKDLLIREDTTVEVTEKAPYYESYYCPVCGDYVEPDSKYCPECGARMGWQILWDE